MTRYKFINKPYLLFVVRCFWQCKLTQCEPAGLGLAQKWMLSIAGVGFPAGGGARANDQDVGVFFPTFALASRAFPPHQGFRGPSIPGAGQHQILVVVSHIGKTHWLCKGNI